MRLTEGESKQLLVEAGIKVPEFFVISRGASLPGHAPYPVMLKAQTLTGGRGKAGLIKKAADAQEAAVQLAELWKQGYAKRPFDQILVEPQLVITRELYVSVTFDTATRGPVLVVSKFGGLDIEVVSKRQPEGVVKTAINHLQGMTSVEMEDVFAKAGLKEDIHPLMRDVVEKLYACFVKNDAELVEINPLAEVMQDGKAALIAVDAKIMLDDAALARHDFHFPRRTGFRPLTEMELAARAIDSQSHRGVVGRTMLELDGDIAFLSSGGGASLTCLDALLTYGGRPADFAEYSGNPEQAHVYQLAKLILSKPGLKGLWVVGPTANFTDVFETLSGIMDALKESGLSIPVVIRRAGPRVAEAKAMVAEVAKETGLDISFFGEEMPMTESAKVLMDKIGT
ncbi:MAG: acetate--CoA ligase family protein [Parcubacteria group bacterium]|nr:acetate--CoA ligase family protein [Parcubacteria group bacterium]